MENKPLCLIVMGMAGSGKTTFVRRLHSLLKIKDKNLFCVNLDPAVKKLHFPANVDICDTIKFKQLMNQYNLGPNGAIMTALNLFATQFEQFMGILESKSGLDYILIDTPGQIEVFSWSASGTIITDTLASSFPTAILYVIDTTRCTNPNSFMSNMLYACSIYYKTRLPILLAFNKTDVQPCEFALEWMTDFESFQESLDKVASDSYLSSLSRSLSLVTDEFYSDLPACGVSSYTGFGFDVLIPMLDRCREQYNSDYLPELNRRRQAFEERRVKDSLDRMESDGAEDMTPIQNLINQLKISDPSNP